MEVQIWENVCLALSPLNGAEGLEFLQEALQPMALPTLAQQLWRQPPRVPVQATFGMRRQG